MKKKSALSSVSPSEPSAPLHYNPSAGDYLAFIVMFFGFSAGAFWLLLRLRANFIQILAALNISKYIFKGAVNMGTFLIGLLVVAGIVWLQTYLNNGLKCGCLWPRAVRVLAGEAILALLSLGTTLLMRLVIFP